MNMHLFADLFPALPSFRIWNALKAFFSLAVVIPQLVIYSILQDSGTVYFLLDESNMKL